MSTTNSQQSAGFTGAPGQIDYTEFTLKNGLHVILHEDHKASVVCLNIAYHVGSKNENESRKGFAHLFEHLLFDGSKNVPRGAFDKFITEAGGQDNAYTTEDKTNYYEVLPSHQLELGLWLESDRMMEFGISEISLVTQKNVVKEEKRERYDNAPYGSLSERMSRLAYDRFPYSWTVIGDMETIDAATLTDVEDFFNTFYVPNNAVLVLTGDFRSDEATALIRKYFEDIPRGAEIRRPIFDEADRTVEQREEVADEEIPMPAVFYGYRIPPDGSRDFMALDLLTDILSSGQSSRLYRKLVYEMQIGSEVSAFVDGREMPGLLYLYAFASEAGIETEALESALQSVIDEVIAAGVTEQELQKALNKTEARMIASRVTVQGKADQLAHSYIFFGDTSRANTMLEEYRSITVEDVRRAAEQYLLPSKRSTVVYRMPDEGKMIDASLLSQDPYHRN
ncbi:MAG TPA: pitrilysin family protein [Candidatus Kapabacteria bacterium]|nr:pitrilysin family protein [Candidatus Kapabacteria bacterium]